MSTTFRFATLAVVFTLALAASASARGHGDRSRHALHQPPAGRAEHSRGLLSQLIFPCPAACNAESRACFDDANDAALACISSDCASQIDAAQLACAEDRRSEGCREAVETLADCADECLDTRAGDIDACRDAVMDCRDACEGEE